MIMKPIIGANTFSHCCRLISGPYSKAFDMIDHKLLLSKMRLQFGVMGEAGDWFQAYLIKWKTPESMYWKGQLTLANTQIWGSPGFYPGTTDVRSTHE